MTPLEFDCTLISFHHQKHRLPLSFHKIGNLLAETLAVIRAFIAIDLPGPIHTRLGESIRQLQLHCNNSRAARWVAAENIHLTMKFLGEVSPTNIQLLSGMLQSEAARHKSFDIKIGGLGAFPTIRRPRVVWTGVAAPPALAGLQKSIEAATIRLGYAPEDKPFSPHLTLARIAHNATLEEVNQIGEALLKNQSGEIGTMRVEAVRLFRSDLRPGGAVYTQLFLAPLANG